MTGNEPAKRVVAGRKCDGCQRPLEGVVYAGIGYELKRSPSGKSYKQTTGPSVTHPDHWPPMGGVTHDATPAWFGQLQDLPSEYQK